MRSVNHDKSGEFEVSNIAFLPLAEGAEFIYRVTDDGNDQNTSLQTEAIVFNVEPVNAGPSLLLSGLTVDEGNAVTISADEVMVTDVDDQSEELTVSVIALPEHGYLLLNGQVLEAGDVFTVGALVNDQRQYVHDGSESSSDTVLISVADGGEDNASAVAGTLQLNINEVIDPAPVIDGDKVVLTSAAADSAAESGIPLNIFHNVLANDQAANQASNQAISSVEDELVLSIHTQAQFGTVVLNQNGTFNYLPDETGVVEDQFSYQLTNSDGTYTIASVDLVFTPELKIAAASPFLSEHVENLAADVETLQEIEAQEEETPVARLTEVSEEPETVEIALDLHATEIRETIENRSFQRNLGRVGEQLDQAEEERQNQITIGSDAAVGVSFSVSAGALAWLLRGGAIFGSMLTVTPLWSSIDPIKMSSKMLNKTKSEGEVERMFDS